MDKNEMNKLLMAKLMGLIDMPTDEEAEICDQMEWPTLDGFNGATGNAYSEIMMPLKVLAMRLFPFTDAELAEMNADSVRSPIDRATEKLAANRRISRDNFLLGFIGAIRNSGSRLGESLANQLLNSIIK